MDSKSTKGGEQSSRTEAVLVVIVAGIIAIAVLAFASKMAGGW